MNNRVDCCSGQTVVWNIRLRPILVKRRANAVCHDAGQRQARQGLQRNAAWRFRGKKIIERWRSMWELACLRCGRRGVSEGSRWRYRRQASSHREAS